MHIAEGMHEFTGAQVANMRGHFREQGVGGNVKRHAQKHIGAALVELAGEFAARDIKLKQSVARRQRHLRHFGDIPRRDDNAPRVGVCAYFVNGAAELVGAFAVCALPCAPLFAIDGTEFAVFVGPFVPDGDAVVVEIFNVGVAAQKPQQFVGDGFPVQFFCRQQREAAREVKAQLSAEDAAHADAGAVGFVGAVLQDIGEQVEVCAHKCIIIAPMDFYYRAEDLQEMAADAVRRARKAGADAAEARIGEDYLKEVGVRCGRLESAESSSSLGVSVRVFAGSRTGSAEVGELSGAALDLAVERAMALAKASATDSCSGLADAELMADTGKLRELSLHHPWALSDDEAFDIARRCEESAQAAHEKINANKSEGASVSTSESQGAYCNSHGFNAFKQKTMHGISCTAIAEEKDTMEEGSWSDSARRAEDLPSPESIGKTAGELAGARLGGRKIKSEKMPVLFRAPCSHSLVWHLVSAASGGALYRNLSWLSADKLGAEKVCAEHITINEDPFIAGGFRSRNFDSEGVAARARDIVEGGIWRGCFLGSYTSRRLKMQTTGNAGGAHNLIVKGRTMPFDSLIKEMGRGFMATELMGSTINPVTGDYSRGASGFWVEGGEIAYPVSEATIAGNVRDILKDIVAFGDDDARRRSSVKCGSVLVGSLTVGGQ